MTEKMAEEGNGAGPSGIVKIKDNFVKITKDRKKFTFIVAKSIELFCLIVATIAESYQTIFKNYQDYPAKIPSYKDMNHGSDFCFRVICIGLNGFIIVNAVLVVSYILGDQLPKKMMCIFSFVGAFISIAAGIILLNDHGDSNNVSNSYANSPDMIISGAFAIIAGLVFALEAVVTHKIYVQ